jgi:hypothetical protein
MLRATDPQGLSYMLMTSPLHEGVTAVDRADRSPDRCQQIIDLIDNCLAEYQASVVSIEHAPLRARPARRAA